MAVGKRVGYLNVSVSVKWRKIGNIDLINMENSYIGIGWEGLTSALKCTHQPITELNVYFVTVHPNLV